MTSRFVGLAGFSRKLEKDPWNLEKDLRGKGQLCALLEGGTVTYMSPEQKWLLSELKKFDKGSEYSAYVALKEQWQITPAISDLFQVGLTVLEMHARGSRWFGYGSITMQEAVRECASRTPEEKVRAMSPTEAERWVVDQLGIDKLAGKIESAGIDGGKLIDLPKLSLADAKKAHQGLSPPVHNKLKAVARNVSTPSDTMQEGIATMLEKCLAVGVGERPATAMDALRSLGRPTWYKEIIFKAKPEWFRMARSEVTEHSDETVATTLGGLAKALVLHGDAPGALSACAEWLGVASNVGTARDNALAAYCNLWKRFGVDSLRVLNLSRGARGHWRQDMLCGEGAVERLAQDVARSDAPIESIDLSEQPQLEGHLFLETLFSSGFSSSNLITLTLKNCKAASGTIPAAVGGCAVLQMLELSGCAFSGAWYPV